MAEQCAFYVRCDRCQYGRNLGSNEYGCRKHRRFSQVQKRTECEIRNHQ